MLKRLSLVALTIFIVAILYNTFHTENLTKVTGWSMDAGDYKSLEMRIDESIDDGNLKSSKARSEDNKEIQQFLDYISKYEIRRSFKNTFYDSASGKAYEALMLQKGEDGNYYFIRFRFLEDRYVMLMSGENNFNKTYRVSNYKELDSGRLEEIFYSLEVQLN